MATAMPGFTAEVAMTPAQPYAMVQAWAESRQKAGVYPQQARMMAREAATDGGASCYCPCCIISGGILWCC
jgi:hypothetical protein